MTAELFDHGWRPDSWRARVTEQQPEWPDPAALDDALAQLGAMPPLVFAGEARTLREQLALTQEGRAFLLVAGDCAESFQAFSADGIRDKLRVILQMSVVLMYGSGVPTIKVGRIAGQFSKPRSAPTETRDGVTLPSFRGDSVNDFAFDDIARRPDPTRLVARLPPERGDAEPGSGVRQGWVRRSLTCERLEPGVRRTQPRGAAVRGARR